ncbi:ATP-binding protein [Streptomyces aureocirculatus]|uniref:ATP-binding protein n=1 Tax=Streptomyces aureocirculatus TaxID=67275 RepID=UPI00068AA011|nr:ATP-binding protein [Streptomyces aureocirculatus]
MITAQHEHQPRTGTGAAPADAMAFPGRTGARREALTSLPATADAAPAMRRFATTSAHAWRLGDGACEALTLVVTELVTNVILHSGSPRVTLRLRLLPGALQIEVHDTGCWHRRVTRRPGGDPADLLHAESGRGLALVEAYTAHTTIRPSRTGTTVLAELPLI